MDESFFGDTVDLAGACKILVKSQRAQTLLKEVISSDALTDALRLMEAGKLDGDLGATVHDLLLQAIDNQATTVWTAYIHEENDRWPLRVNEYEGVYWVSALESDSVGYFLDKSSAIYFAQFNWDNVVEDNDISKTPNE